MPFISANICLTSLKPQLLFARSLVIAKHAKLMGRDRVALGRIFFGEEVTHGIDEAMCYGRREGDVFVARKMRVHTGAEFERRRQQRDALGARPVPARRGCQRVGGKRRVADNGVTTSPSRISIVAKRVLSGRRAKLSVERNVQQYVQHENRPKA
jgi:hypothetical protein